MKHSFVRILSTLALVGAIGACGDDDPMTPDPDPDPNPSGGRTVKANPAFTADVQEIFDRRGCTASQCHGTDPGQAGLNLSAGSSYADLVNVASSQDPNFIRVVPDSASVSLLYLKVLANPPIGGRMPVGGTLDTIDTNNIRNWIDTGAPNN
ncbi:MAG: hypothetical protein OEO23_08350 [Gemmatimonadota bacterium]|nr:hypothetical protein [Gemmatimonadota bacterium]